MYIHVCMSDMWKVSFGHIKYTCTCTFVLQCVGVSKAPPRVYTVETTAGVVRSCHLTANSGS